MVEGDGKQAPLCVVCEKTFSKYKCPRCSTDYCSVPCYKQHSSECVEGFAKDSIAEHLRTQIADEDEVREMAQMLQRSQRLHQDPASLLDTTSPLYAHEQDSPETEMLGADELAELEKLQISTSDLLAELTPEELREFEQDLKAGRVDGLVESWQPWWRDRRCLIVDSSTMHDFPDILPDIPHLSSLTPRQPSPDLIYHLLQILFSYCWTLRQLNGDWKSDPTAAAHSLLALSPLLTDPKNLPPPSTSAVLNSCTARSTQHPTLRSQRSLAVLSVSDVSKVLELGQRGVLLALSDVHTIVMQGGGQGLKAKRICKKLEFFLSWANAVQREGWEAVAGEVGGVAEEMSGSLPKLGSARREGGGNRVDAIRKLVTEP